MFKLLKNGIESVDDVRTKYLSLNVKVSIQKSAWKFIFQWKLLQNVHSRTATSIPLISHPTWSDKFFSILIFISKFFWPKIIHGFKLRNWKATKLNWKQWNFISKAFMFLCSPRLHQYFINFINMSRADRQQFLFYKALSYWWNILWKIIS